MQEFSRREPGPASMLSLRRNLAQRSSAPILTKQRRGSIFKGVAAVFPFIFLGSIIGAAITLTAKRAMNSQAGSTDTDVLPFIGTADTFSSWGGLLSDVSPQGRRSVLADPSFQVSNLVSSPLKHR